MTSVCRRRSGVCGWVAGSPAAPIALHPKEGPAVPPRAADRACGGAQALVPTPLPLEAVGEHRDLLLDATPLADELRPHDRPVHDALSGGLRVETIGQRVQPGPGRGLEPAIRQFLDPVC